MTLFHLPAQRLRRGLSLLALAATAFAATSALAHGGATAYAGNFAHDTLAQINGYRAANGLPALQMERTLLGIAKMGSNRLHSTKVLSHAGFNERMDRSGFSHCVENLAWNYTTPETVLQGWINSPTHNRMLLNPRIQYAGIAKTGPWVTYFACS